MSIVTGWRGLVAFIAAACLGEALLGGALAATPLFTSASSIATQAPSSSMTVPRPTGTGAGSVLVAAVAFRADAAAPITAPAGWSQVVRTSCAHTTTVLTQALFVRVASAAEPTSYAFSTSAPTGGVASILAYTGVDLAQPVHASTGAFTRNTKAASPALTTTIPQTRLVGAFSHSGTATISQPPGMTSRSDAATGGSSPTAALLTTDETLAAAGSYTRKAQAQTPQGCNIGQLVALRSAPDAPANTSPPAVSGTAREGSTLNASTGTWSGSPTSYAYQWRRCDGAGGNCTDIPGEAAAAHTLTSGDVGSTIRALVTASNAGGSASASSAPTEAVIPAAAPSNISPPGISGTAQEGHELSASTGTWSGSPTSYAYEWQRCDGSGANCTPISGADESTYSLETDDVGARLRVQVSATNAGGTTAANSAATAIVLAAAPTNTSLPLVSGLAREGETLTASAGEWTGDPTTALQWERCNQSGGSCAALPGETANAHLLVPADVGSTLRVVVTATNAGGSSTAASAVSALVLPLPPANVTPPALSGTAQEGQLLSASTGTWTSSAALSYAYRWQRSSDGSVWTDIGSAASATYTLTSAEVGMIVRAVVTASNAGGSASASSAPTATVAGSLRPANTIPPTMAGFIQGGRTLDAAVGTWTGTPTAFAYQWQQSADNGLTWVDIPGAAASKYVIATAFVGRDLRVLVTASNAHGPTSAPSFAARIYPTGNLAVLVNKAWNCNGAINLDLVKVTMWTIDVDSVVFNTGCTGRIGRIEVDTWTGDGVKVTNSNANAAHDLVVESGYTACFNRLVGAHQDGVQVMGGARITFKNFVWRCGNMSDASGSGVANAVFIARAGAGATTPTDIVVEHSVLMPGASHTLTVGVSLRSGVRNSVLCPDRTGSNPFTNSGATEPVYSGVVEPPTSDARCSSFASALAWAQGP